MSGALLLPPSTGSGGAVDTVTAGNSSITVGGTTANPTVEVTAPLSLANGGTGVEAVSDAALLSSLGAAPLASPAFTGTPTGISGQYLRAPAVYVNATPPSTTSATWVAVDSGVVCTGSFTAPASGEVLVTVSCVIGLSAAVAFGFALAGSVGGTSIGAGSFACTVNTANSTQRPGLAMQFPVTGLTAGTGYNFDLLYAIVSSDTLTVYCDPISSGQISSGGAGAPVVITVQAV